MAATHSDALPPWLPVNAATMQQDMDDSGPECAQGVASFLWHHREGLSTAVSLILAWVGSPAGLALTGDDRGGVDGDARSQVMHRRALLLTAASFALTGLHHALYDVLVCRPGSAVPASLRAVGEGRGVHAAASSASAETSRLGEVGREGASAETSRLPPAPPLRGPVPELDLMAALDRAGYWEGEGEGGCCFPCHGSTEGGGGGGEAARDGSGPPTPAPPPTPSLCHPPSKAGMVYLPPLHVAGKQVAGGWVSASELRLAAGTGSPLAQYLSVAGGGTVSGGCSALFRACFSPCRAFLRPDRSIAIIALPFILLVGGCLPFVVAVLTPSGWRAGGAIALACGACGSALNLSHLRLEVRAAAAGSRRARGGRAILHATGRMFLLTLALFCTTAPAIVCTALAMRAVGQGQEDGEGLPSIGDGTGTMMLIAFLPAVAPALGLRLLHTLVPCMSPTLDSAIMSRPSLFLGGTDLLSLAAHACACAAMVHVLSGQAGDAVRPFLSSSSAPSPLESCALAVMAVPLATVLLVWAGWRVCVCLAGLAASNARRVGRRGEGAGTPLSLHASALNAALSPFFPPGDGTREGAGMTPSLHASQWVMGALFACLRSIQPGIALALSLRQPGPVPSALRHALALDIASAYALACIVQHMGLALLQAIGVGRAVQARAEAVQGGEGAGVIPDLVTAVYVGCGWMDGTPYEAQGGEGHTPPPPPTVHNIMRGAGGGAGRAPDAQAAPSPTGTGLYPVAEYLPPSPPTPSVERALTYDGPSPSPLPVSVPLYVAVADPTGQAPFMLVLAGTGKEEEGEAEEVHAPEDAVSIEAALRHARDGVDMDALQAALDRARRLLGGDVTSRTPNPQPKPASPLPMSAASRAALRVIRREFTSPR